MLVTLSTGRKLVRADDGTGVAQVSKVLRSPVRWGVLGPGMIAVERTIPAMVASDVADIAAIASRDAARGARIASAWRGCRAHASYDALLADDAIDAVYIALPNHLHLEWTVRALAAGKHVLCEKPLSPSPSDIATIVLARDATGLHVEEAFAYRNHPQWQAIATVIADRRIGTINAAHAVIAKRFLDPGDIRNSPDGGGALLDLGSYSISAFNLIFGRMPQRVIGTMDRDPDFGIDRLTSAMLDYGGAHASLSVGTQSGTDAWGTHQSLTLLGSEGWIRLDFPFAHARPTQCHLFLGNSSSVGNFASEVITFPPADHYRLQVDRFSRLLLGDDVPSWPIEDALCTAQISAAILKSASSNQWIEPERADASA